MIIRFKNKDDNWHRENGPAFINGNHFLKMFINGVWYNYRKVTDKNNTAYYLNGKKYFINERSKKTSTRSIRRNWKI